MEVKLLRHTPEPEKTVAMSARLCYSPVGAAQLEETMSDEQAAKLVRKLVEMGHFSTLEHVTFTFAIEGVSRVLTHQLVRHRIASYSQQSQRYVKEHDFETIILLFPQGLRQKLSLNSLWLIFRLGIMNLLMNLESRQRMPVMYFLMRLKLKLWQHLMSGL